MQLCRQATEAADASSVSSYGIQSLARNVTLVVVKEGRLGENRLSHHYVVEKKILHSKTQRHWHFFEQRCMIDVFSKAISHWKLMRKQSSNKGL